MEQCADGAPAGDGVRGVDRVLRLRRKPWLQISHMRLSVACRNGASARFSTLELLCLVLHDTIAAEAHVGGGERCVVSSAR